VAPRTPDAALADGQAVAGVLAHWAEALVQIDYLDPAAPRKLMPRLNQLLNRAQLTSEEVHILRGVARAIQRKALPNVEPNVVPKALPKADTP
jgi:tRNA/rRNA methyltransferase